MHPRQSKQALSWLTRIVMVLYVVSFIIDRTAFLQLVSLSNRY